MVVELNDKKACEKGGNKAKYLMMMKEAGFKVPDGFVIDSDTYLEEISYNNIHHKIDDLLKTIQLDNISKISNKIIKLFDSFQFQKSTVDSILSLLKKDKLYAVRSSGTKEDLDHFSFAGQYETYLNVEVDDILKRVIDCYKSMFSEVILSYFVNNHLSFNHMAMSVIVQEMVPSEYSGICFTIDPVTGNDKKMVIEIAPGLGENIVSGQNRPEQYYYDWFYGKFYTSEKNHYLSNCLFKKLGHTFFDIMKYFGYPCDIEFGIYEDQLYILQARPITKIEYQDYDYLWSTADFKDGGVSASVCTPYMWSLYEYIWEYVLRKFIVDSKILKDDELPKKLGDMFFGRCYWNLSAVKKAMSRIIGYKEREFDSEYGIAPTYDGDGETTGLSIQSLFSILRIALAQKRIVKTREKNAQKYKDELLYKYYYYKGLYDTQSYSDIKNVWKKLVQDEYLQSESTYFWQIFINTVHQSLNKERLLTYMNESDYLTLIGNIDDISHLLPFYDMWDVSRLIRKDEECFSYWKKNSVETIVENILQKKKNYCFEKVQKIIGLYGYHSDKELDVTYPCYYEDITPIVTNIRDLVLLDDNYSPYLDQQKGHDNYQNKLRELKEKVGDEFQKIEPKIEKIRNMLWWREEFRDVSTRFYYLIRIYTIELAKELVRDKVLSQVDDIWFLKIGDLWDYLDGKITREDIWLLVSRNRDYYQAYRNYMSENEIGNHISHVVSDHSSHIKGLGANNGVVTGVARVIPSFDEIDRLQEGDILVTKFTDTGWTPKFAILSGIVTEFGGILCHAAIVSREYGIPSIVSCSNVLQEIHDGDIITINGTTGEVVKEE